MNVRPGFSIGWSLYPNGEDHEGRERDYFFVVSFVTWGLWAGIGMGTLARDVVARGGARAAALAHAALALALLPVAANWRDATRRGPDRELAADFAYNLLNSVPPYGILFTYGDNDTFPLWWAQEVEGIRRDVTIVCLALAQTDWYMRQLRDNPTRDFDPGTAPVPWQGRHAARPDWPLHTMTDEEIASAASVPIMLDRPTTVQFGPLTATYPERTIFYPNDVVAMRIIQQNVGRRPIVWGVTSGRDFAGLGAHVVQQALAFRLETTTPDTTRPGIVRGGIGGVLIDVPLTRTLAWETYRYGPLLTEDTRRLESTSASIASTLSIPFSLLAYADDVQGDTASVKKQLERAARIAPSEALEAALEAYGR
jgi:hypothetical protein